MDVFQEAAKAAQARHGDGWFALPPREQTRAIYAEMRRIDEEQAQAAQSAAVRNGGRGVQRRGGRTLAA